MAYEKMTKNVAWFLQKKNLIKFTDEDTTYPLSEKVIAANDFVQYPLPKGIAVDVSISEGKIVYLRKSKSEAPKVVPLISEPKGSEEAYEPTPEEEKPKTPSPAPIVETPKVVGEMKELTIYAIATNKKVIKFVENKDAGWMQIDESLQTKDFQAIGLVAKNKVKVQIVENKVISVEKVAIEASLSSQEAPSKSEPAKADSPAVEAPKQAPVAKKEWVPYKSQDNDARQTSIECQAMINSSCQVVGMMAANIEPKPTANVLNSMIRAIALENYQLLQDLKKK
jgi:hypothetical protein